jgi:hypothetical protein
VALSALVALLCVTAINARQRPDPFKNVTVLQYRVAQ